MFRWFRKFSSLKDFDGPPPYSFAYKKKVLRKIGPYRLKQNLGKGGMAEVWLGSRGASDDINKTVAIKLLDPSLIFDATHQKMFYEEAKLSMKLTHSNIVQVFDMGRKKNQSYLVMEWVDGTTLAELCRCLYGHGLRLEVECGTREQPLHHEDDGDQRHRLLG